MFWTNFKRIFRSGFVSFFRNGFVSLAAILVMSITLFAVGSLLFSGALLEDSLDELRERVDINVYFVTDATEEDVLAVKAALEGLPEVASVEYTSREQALADFEERYAEDQLTLQALEELGENPLGASLSIKARETQQYEGIANFLESDNVISITETPIIDNVNYFRNRVAIDKLTEIIVTSEQSNFMKTILLVLVSVLITFNTIRLAIYNSREEIRVMKLVGASNTYVQGPFVVTGAMYGIVASAVALAIFYPVTQWFGPIFYPFNFFSNIDNIDLLAYYSSNFVDIFLITISVGIGLGVVSSFLAVKKYINV
jgi:cell division transport system permease protein